MLCKIEKTTYRSFRCRICYAFIQVGLGELVHAADVFILDPGFDGRLHAIVVDGLTVLLLALSERARCRLPPALSVQLTELLSEGRLLLSQCDLLVQAGALVLLLAGGQGGAGLLLLRLGLLSELGCIHKWGRCWFRGLPSVFFFLVKLNSKSRMEG